ncbi:predicted protein [Plenodomus lingam JN3]|uniref:Predicted protein n=1 Tax=Leptosphaeria maculans (strain JN3 / isolate v23.1.3 / race Av1-4-5-6-7-8) TaxID=985895 RepID=E5AC45_LEPMJ|nr:predicted protein [Plenodomus lingam JN3]CBY00156.1 predicted protein [Plenodomus lingam JN3]
MYLYKKIYTHSLALALNLFHAQAHENLSPLLLLYASLASYLLFSRALCSSLSASCRVGAGSRLASALGPDSSAPPSPLLLCISPSTPPGAVVAVGFSGVVAVRWVPEEDEAVSDFSSSHARCRFWRSSSAFCARSALMLRLAKK